MNSAILYLPYLPNVFWLKNFFQHENVLIEGEENFVKSTFRNRCEIAGANGRQLLSIPLVGGRDHHQLYKDVRIDYCTSWNRKHWQSIRAAYGSAPFFEYYADRFQPLYEKQFEYLLEFNLEMLQLVLKLLKFEKPFQLTLNYERNYSGIVDLRQAETISSSFVRYYQVFEERNGFQPNLSIIDIIFNLGPEAKEYLIHEL